MRKTLGDCLDVRHPLLSFPYVADAPWDDGSDSRFPRGAVYIYEFPISVTAEEMTTQLRQQHD